MFTGTLDPASNRADWQFAIELVDLDGNDLNLSGATINIAIRTQGQILPLLTGSTSDGHIFITGLGNFNVSFSPAEMRILNPGSYDVGLTAKFASGITYQILANATLPVIDGVMA